MEGILKLPQEQLEKMPAGIPPPGQTANFVNPPSDGWIFILTGAIAVVFMLLFAGLRYYTKLFIHRKTSADDWFTLGAIVGTVFYYITAVVGVTLGPYGTHMWNLTVATILSNDTIITGFLLNWSTSLIVTLAKTAFFLMYIQLFKPFRWLRWAAYVGLIVNWLFCIAVITVALYYTAPRPGQSWQEDFLDPRYFKSIGTAIPISAGSLALDVYIFVLPLVAVDKLQLSTRKKFEVSIVFATGFAACLASSISIYYRYVLNKHKEDFIFHVMHVILLVLIEMCVGIAASCMPSCAHFLRSSRSKWLISRAANTNCGNGTWSKFTGRSAQLSNLNGARVPLNSQDSEREFQPHKTYETVVTIQERKDAPQMEKTHIYVDRTFYSETHG